MSDQENYEEITATSYTEEWRSYYDYRLTMRYPFSWGIRYIILDGYYYYPDVALNFVDITIEQQLYEVSKYFSPRDFSDNLVRITKNLKAMYIFDYIDITWIVPEGMLDKHEHLSQAGSYVITAQYKGLEASLTIFVS